MKKLNTGEWIAVFAGVGVVTLLLFGNTIIGFYKPAKDKNNSMAQTSGVATQDLVVGQGELAVAGDMVTVHYVGVLTDGKVFDSSLDRNVPYRFPLGAGQVIKGWDEGLVGMREGGRRRLVIAPDYAYGKDGYGPIPPNATLVFDVELIKVEHPAR